MRVVSYWILVISYWCVVLAYIYNSGRINKPKSRNQEDGKLLSMKVFYMHPSKENISDKFNEIAYQLCSFSG